MNAVIGNFTQEKGGMFPALLRGILLAFILTLASFFVFSLLIAYTGFPESAVGTVVVITTIASLFIAGLYISRRMKSGGLKNGVLLGLIYTVIVYLVSSIAYRSFALSAGTLIMLVICVFSAATGGVMGVNFKGRRKKRA